MTLSRAQRRLRARVAAFAMHAKHPDGAAVTAKARERFLAQFPNEAAKREYFARLNYLNAVGKRQEASSMSVPEAVHLLVEWAGEDTEREVVTLEQERQGE